jgi:hypothetical protein
MREMVFVAAAALVFAVPTAAVGKDGAEVAVSRTYSAMYFMRVVCPKHIRVDLDFASKMSEAILAQGNKELDAATMQATIVPEVERRRAEVAAAGESAWCKSQRALMREIGLGKVFGE